MAEFPNVNMGQTFREDLLYPELSYQIVGVLFTVHTDLGNRLKESHYQKAVSSALIELKIPFVEQVHIPLHYKSRYIGKLFADFLIDDKIILEIKALHRLTPVDYRQVQTYLGTLNKELAILANFRPSNLTFRRILNTHL